MQKKDQKTLTKEFETRQTRQIIAIAVALFIVLLCAVLHKRPLFSLIFSKGTLFSIQVATIAAFFGFTMFNWRCPSCGKSLGSDIFRAVCRKCGMRFK